MTNSKSARGFTLVELMIVIVLLVIVATIALPNFVQFIRNNQVQAKTNEVVSFLNYARGQAVTSRKVYEINVVNDELWTVGQAGQDVERELSFNVGQAKPVIAGLSGDKLIVRANGMMQEPLRITVCRDNDFKNGYWIDVKPSGIVQVFNRGMKGLSSTDKMTSCTP